MIKTNPAPATKPILEVIQNRWSPVGFSPKPVEEEKLETLLEAARWAPSSFNEQPWQYMVGRFGDPVHARLCECLNEGNAWAKNAGVLMLSVAKTFFEHKHKPNRHYLHDTGAASAYMVLQATEIGLLSHQMAGFSLEKARALFKIPADYEPGSMIAIGYALEAKDLTPEQREREAQPRVRKPAADLLWRA